MNNIFVAKHLYMIVLFLCFGVSYAGKFEFNDLQVFGDSLSDQGSHGKIAVANSKNSIVYPQYLSNIFTGKNITAFKDTNLLGTNHSAIGLTSIQSLIIII